MLGGQLADRSLALIPGPSGEPPDFDEDVRPWFGGEAAIAVLAGARGVIPSGSTCSRSRTQQARADYAGVARRRPGADDRVRGDRGEPRPAGRRHREVERLPRDRHRGRRRGGDRDRDRRRRRRVAGRRRRPRPRSATSCPTTASPRPGSRRTGSRELIAPNGGTLGTLTPLVAPGATRGVAASLSAVRRRRSSSPCAAPSTRSARRARRASSPPSRRSSPSLPERLRAEDARLPRDRAAGGDGRRRCSPRPARRRPGSPPGFEDLVERLRRKGDVDLEGDLLAALGDEAAFALEPAPETRPAIGAGALPYLQFVADGVDEDEARAGARRAPGRRSPRRSTPETSCQAPVFGQQEVARGRDQQPARLADGRAHLRGLRRARRDRHRPGGGRRADRGRRRPRRAATSTRRRPRASRTRSRCSPSSTSAAWSRSASRPGSPRIRCYATFAGDFRRLDALGLAVSDRTTCWRPTCGCWSASSSARGRRPRCPSR